ncbi:DUF2306 domain-containing protein [Bailinhaonella thermotolerans]|uniref:DUF2306 domain-containing protein n=1 Tax=Bailinhaonella thermotolerans TaxID=1070861 RepID=A0A3A4B3G6_9ACTN|nr:DUF2306 domain-containing protein [Bailinhaonella thermotolerans]RJL31930.1 DUF2306 domain-containing protein [Bailinhaonella thermotolerans]
MTDASPPSRRLPAPRLPPARLPPARRAPRRAAGILVPAGLLALTAVPVVAGALRLSELAGGAAVLPADARFSPAPPSLVLHIVTAIVYGVAGAFQFAPGIRRRAPGTHRALGRVLVPCGLAVALSGLWLTWFHPRPEGDELLAVFRFGFGSAMALSLVLGLAAIRRRDVARHRAWMARGYAIGLGAGTQALTQIPALLLPGPPGETTRALLLAAGWVINLAVAEWFIRTRAAVPGAARRTEPVSS